MKRQKMIWSQQNGEDRLFWLEQGQCQSVPVFSHMAAKQGKGKLTVLLPPAAVEARLLRFPAAGAKDTQKMVARALETSSEQGKAAGYRWRAAKYEAGEQWLFTLASSAEKWQEVKREAESLGLDVKTAVSVYEGLWTLWQLISAADELETDVVLLYRSADNMTLLFLQNGQPIHGQTISRVQSAEEMAVAYQRVVHALSRQKIWQQTQKLFYLDEAKVPPALAKQLALLAETEVILLNAQVPFCQWQGEAEPLLVRAILEAEEKRLLAEGWWQDRLPMGRVQRSEKKLWAAVAMVAVAGSCYLGSNVLLWRAQAAVVEQASTTVLPQMTKREQVVTDYGAILQQIAAEKGDLQLQEMQWDEKGLMIYASAPNWAETAAFSERLKKVAGMGSVNIVRSEKLLRLEDQTLMSYVALTIRLDWKGDYADES